MSEAAASLIARTDKALAGLEADAIASMNLALTNSYLQLEKQLLAAYPNYTAAAQPNLLANQRALLLFDELKTVLSASSMDAVKPALEKVYEKVLGAAAGEGTTLSDELMRLRGGDSFVTATGKVPIEAIAQAAKNAAELVVGKDQAFKAEARYLIIQGLATGAGGRKVAGQLRQRLGVSKGRAENIARTEINRAQNEAAKVNYKTNGIEYFQSIATADGRLCPYCGDRNGNVYRLDEASIPYHGGCRCYAAPFSPHWEDLGLTSNEWVKDFHDEGLALLEKQGGKANKGPTYFEKKAGMTTAPKPVWSPGKGYLVDKAKLLAADPFMLEKAAAEKAKEQAVEEKKPTKAKKKSEKAPKVPKAKAKKEAQAIAGNGLKSHDETFEYNGNPDEIFENSTTESDYNKKMDAYEKKSIAQLKKYGLTDQEAKYALAGIHEWTETDAGSKKLSDLSLKGKISDKLDGLEALLEKVPGYDGPVYKGASFATEKEYENFLTEFKTGGQTLSISEFSSNINVAAKDMLKGKEIKAVVAVKGNKSGVSISNLSYYGQKKFEVLVPKAVQYKLVSVDDVKIGNATVRKIVVEEIGKAELSEEQQAQKAIEKAKKAALDKELEAMKATAAQAMKKGSAEAQKKVEKERNAALEKAKKENEKKAKKAAKESAEKEAQIKARAAEAAKKSAEIKAKTIEKAAKATKEQATKTPKANTSTVTTSTQKPSRQQLLFPTNLNGLEEIGGLGGSTGAKLVRDPKTGKQYVLKRGGSENHLREEINADRAYQALGVPVPKFMLYETDKGPVKLAEFIEGKPLSALSGKAKEAALKKLSKDFAVDALLGNWDVVGLSGDNVLVDGSGQVYRIDNGGSLRYRAQGAQKREAWNGYPQELWTLRDRNINSQTADAFKSLSISEIAKQIDRIGKKQEKLLASLPPELHATMSNRLDELMQTAYVTKIFKADKFKDDYTDGFAKHGMGIRAAGITERMPDRLEQKHEGSVIVFDENGKKFDHLRGEGSLIRDLQRYTDSQGGSYKAMERWMDSQAGSSWSKGAAALKWYLAQQRDTSEDSFFWLGGKDSAQRNYEEISQREGGASVYSTSIQALHAFNYEMIRSVKFNNRDEQTETIQLMRTENIEVMQKYGLKKGDKNIKISRGVAESTSIFKEVTVCGTEMTVQYVPWHRVIGSYFHERGPESDSCSFLGNSENEFVAMIGDLPFDYVSGPPKTLETVGVAKIQQPESQSNSKGQQAQPTVFDDDDADEYWVSELIG